MVADEREKWIERTVSEHDKIMENSWERCDALIASWEGMRGESFFPFGIDPFKGKKVT